MIVGRARNPPSKGIQKSVMALQSAAPRSAWSWLSIIQKGSKDRVRGLTGVWFFMVFCIFGAMCRRHAQFDV